MKAGQIISNGPNADGEPPDPLVYPQLYEGIIWRRVVAYMLDLLALAVISLGTFIIFTILGVLSLGLLSPFLALIYALIPLAYHSLLLSGSQRATFGMRFFDLTARRGDGAPIPLLQALIVTILFYLSLGFPIILLVALFNNRGRTLHDIVAGTVILRATALTEIEPQTIEAYPVN